MVDVLSTFSSRTFSIPGYSAPLFVHVLDADIQNVETSLQSIVQDILLVPERKVITGDRWRFITDVALKILADNEFWQKFLSERIKSSTIWQESINEVLTFYRQETSRHFERVREDHTLFAYQALTGLLYRASEGYIADDEYGIPTMLPLPRFSAVLREELIARTENNKDFHFGKDDLLVWQQVNSFISTSISQEFKASFTPLLDYEIPYGMSPETKSETLSKIIENSKTIAVVPFLAGATTITTAISNGDLVLALKTALTTGAVVIVLMSTIALSDAIIRWMKKEEIKTKDNNTQGS